MPTRGRCDRSSKNTSKRSTALGGQSSVAGLAKINVVFGSAGRPGWYARVLSHYVRPRLVRALWPRHDGLDCAREPPENGDVRRRRGESPRLNELQRPDVGKSFPYELQHQWVVLSLPCLRSSLMVVTGLWQLIRQWKVRKRILCFTAAARSSYVLNVAKSALACKCPTKPTAGCSRVPHKNSKPRIWQVEFQLHEFNTVHVAAASCFPTVEAQVDDRAIFLAFSGAVLEGGGTANPCD